MAFTQQVLNRKTRVRRQWLERILAIIALINFCFVLFDLSYVAWRDVYLHQFPSIIQFYDQIKGIQPHRETQIYLNKVNQLEIEINRTSIDSPLVENLLQELRDRSNEMIADNPFAVANKSGTLENIKYRMRVHVNQDSAHQAFAIFWSHDYLSQTNLQQEITFFNTRIRPLIETNYYRGISFNGKFIDNFWLIDLPFTLLFGLEFLVRTFSISRTNIGVNWLEAMLRRWYDIFLLLPFWRWLRIIPVSIRLQQANLLNLQPIRTQINREFVTNFAEELTEVVGVRIIDQAQNSIRRGDISKWLFRDETNRPYININDTNELQAIAAHLLRLSVYQVLPKIQPDIEALLHHSIANILNQSPVYRQIKNVPGVSNLPNQLTEKLAKDLAQSFYNTLTTFLEDSTAIKLFNKLIENFSKALKAELKQQANTQQIQFLLIDLLEEIKINYVKDIAEQGVEKTWEESYQIRKHTPPAN